MLYIVPTPIGNLEDMTYRAVRILREADLILAEDTRTSKRLLDHYEISTPLKSFHIHNEHAQVNKVIAMLKEGKDLALVSDAGTPGISDPGFLLARAAVNEGIDFTVLPGPTAVIPALVLSGLPSDDFRFVGFLPPKKGRQKKLTELQDSSYTLIFYESPHRIAKLAGELATYFPERPVALVREISKLHEEVWRGTPDELTAHVEASKPKGEMVVIVGPPPKA
jgi:16S rRNA (cytidine1402-2'-O)-methyltransferase